MAACLTAHRRKADLLPGGSVSMRVPAILSDKVKLFLELYEDMALGRQICLDPHEAERHQLIEDFKRMMDYERDRLDKRREIEDQRQRSLF